MIITLGVLDLVDFCFNVSLIKFQPIKTTEPSFGASDCNILTLLMNSDENSDDGEGNDDDGTTRCASLSSIGRSPW